MKKGFIALACVFLLTGCSLGTSKKEDKNESKTTQSTKKEDKTVRMEPKKAVEALINGVIYEKDLDQLEKAFDVSTSDLEGIIESSFVSGFMESTDNSEEPEKQALDLWTTLANQVKEKTTYKVSVVKYDAKKPVLKVEVTGIDMSSLDELVQDRVLKEVAENPAIAEDEAQLTDFIFNIYREELVNVKVTETAQSFEIKLAPDSLNKKVWTFDDSDNEMSKMLASFFFSEASDDDLDDEA